ncbi:YjbH domain-containing protein [uncultured Lentibacter sp.]|uniref:YjbH domain-containing protein n=1 Tax=uncultured Lentibacter sp. TaxID=1659309 RepID=UPI00260D96BB|nr:YjbH domain-containing protein [uncultured Lentibacter sp.]
MFKASVLRAVVGAFLLPQALSANEQTTEWVNMYGLSSGLIDMPTAEVAQDGRLSTTLSYFGRTTKTNLSFQLTPRLSGVFRYSALRGLTVTGYSLPSYYDRSFDVHYRLLDEGRYRPALAVGLRDLLGTGLHGGEYVVATKSIGSKFRLTGGLGWGRLGSHDSFATLGTRPTGILGAGGIPNYDRWFRGPVAGFAGLGYQHSKKLGFAVEYSSDAYTQEDGDIVTINSPLNFGVKYKLNNTIQLGASYMYGSEFGLNVSLTLDPKNTPVIGGTDTAPQPVARRTGKSAHDLGWTDEVTQTARIKTELAKALAREGIVLEGIRISQTSADLLIRNERFDIQSQALGRTLRIMTRILPASVETLSVTQSNQGVPTGSLTVARSDIEDLEHSPSSNILKRVRFSADRRSDHYEPLSQTYPRLNWRFGPVVQLSVFDPDSPVRADVVAKAEAQYHIAPGWVASGALSYKLGGNLDGLSPNRTGIVPVNPPHKVRSDARFYAMGRGPKIEHLTIAKFGRLGENLYGRLTVGYLEQMYAGLSGELLWKPVSSRLALGAELNYVAQRDFDQRFGLQDYSVATGHLSAYYDFGNGYHTQIDVGRYLAGDYGATVTLDREFGNGWRVGAYVTKTDLSAAQFGEGSFDKGIRITVPMSWALGNATKRKSESTIRSLTRDGGARVNVTGRLYSSVRDTHGAEMQKTWGRFWR